MSLRISGKNMDIGSALRSQVEDRLKGALGKYFGGSFNGHVTVEREGTGYRADCVLHLTSGITLESAGTAHDAYAAFDQTAGRIERRLRRYKHRLKDHGAANGRASPDGDAEALEASYAVIEAPAEEVEEEGYHPVIIAEATRSLHSRSVREAVLDLDLTGAPCLVFRHAGTGRVNIVYRRSDGAIGWIDPPSE